MLPQCLPLSFSSIRFTSQEMSKIWKANDGRTTDNMPWHKLTWSKDYTPGCMQSYNGRHRKTQQKPRLGTVSKNVYWGLGWGGWGGVGAETDFTWPQPSSFALPQYTQTYAQSAWVVFKSSIKHLREHITQTNTEIKQRNDRDWTVRNNWNAEATKLKKKKQSKSDGPVQIYLSFQRVANYFFPFYCSFWCEDSSSCRFPFVRPFVRLSVNSSDHPRLQVHRWTTITSTTIYSDQPSP